ncbi:hypothetical protein CWI69_02100 [Pseudidiomarina halophila]|uniref:Uncharacterized protein n=1 Tax=Pseudidiomarina halophila TaxID=1449799 RepID=A0A432XZS1_9GAMM|nr:hypothetical protein CWI69_02100 [Pseudidiomarina halophila]
MFDMLNHNLEVVANKFFYDWFMQIVYILCVLYIPIFLARRKEDGFFGITVIYFVATIVPFAQLLLLLIALPISLGSILSLIKDS